MAVRPLRVEKIGGTTINRIYVVSAYAGITNELLEHKKTGQAGIYQTFVHGEDYGPAMLRLQQQLCEINSGLANIGLNVDEADAFICDRISYSVDILNSMDTVLGTGYIQRQEVLLAAREILASIGEVHSAFNSANILQNLGYNSTFIDLSGWKSRTECTIDQRIAAAFKGVDPRQTICVATGYTKGTEGIMREFDRGYSEVTFSKIAVQMRAAEAVIHKEYHLCSGDPIIIGEDKVHPVGNTNYDVADQLADVGMEAIHPKASKPLETAGIPIRMKNAFDPAHAGTLITSDYICPSSKTEIVTGSDKVSCVEIHDTRMVGEVGFDLRIMQVLAKNSVSYINKATNANTIDIIIYDKEYPYRITDITPDKYAVYHCQRAVCAGAAGAARCSLYRVARAVILL